MKIKLLIICIFFFSLLKAQDSHFSQYSIIKSYLNPSLVGYQQEDFQVQLQRRSQWASVSKPFTTFSLAINQKNIINNISWAAQLLNDKAGDSNFSTNGISFGISKKNNLSSKNNISAGILLGYYRRFLDHGSLFFIQNENIPSYSVNFFDFSLGVTCEYELMHNITLLSGVSFFHINNPDQSFFNNKKVRLKNNNKIHSSLIYYVTPKAQINPSIYYTNHGEQKEIIFGVNMNYLLTNYIKDRVVLRASVFNRYNDAIIPMIGFKIDNFDIMISYDVNTSSLINASDYKGGFEFAIIYNWSIEKNSKNQEKLVCPKYL